MIYGIYIENFNSVQLMFSDEFIQLLGKEENLLRYN